MKMRINLLVPVVLCALVAGTALAADPQPAAAKPADAPKTVKGFPAVGAAGAGNANDRSSDLTTNVGGSQEAPTVLNVVPWKDKEVKIEKKSPTTSILNQVLQPLDRDVLRREVQYFRSLQETKTQ